MQKVYIIVALAITVVTYSGCAVGKQGVYLAEMPTSPILIIHQDTLYVKPLNSIKNSALCIYKVNISVDNFQKEIYLSAYQALCGSKPYRDIFQIKLGKYKVSEPNLFEFYWRDPDKKITKLEITP